MIARGLPVALVMGLLSAGLAACPGGGARETSTRGVTAAAVRQHAFCQPPGLERPLRQTVLVIDGRVVRPGTDEAPFAQQNPELFQLIRTLADPGPAVQSGVMAPRERLLIHIAPADGSAARLIFSGCVPGVSDAERAGLAAGRSSVSNATDTFFGRGADAEAVKAFDSFRRAALGAVTQAGEAGAGSAGPRGDSFVQSSLVRAMRAAGPLSTAEDGVPRVYIFTDLKRVTPPGVADAAAARRAGFTAAEAASLQLGRAEVHMAGPGGGDPNGKEFAAAYLLASQGRLHTWGGSATANAPAAPTRLEVLSGEIDYDRPTPAQLRLAVDRNGVLVNSWFVVKTEREYATPVTGTLTCDADGACRLASDQSGFAQAWSPDPDAEAEFDGALPLGGLRYLEGFLSEGRFTGRVFDPQVEDIGGRSDLPVRLVTIAEGKL